MEEQLNTSTASPQPEINTKHDVDQRLKDSDDTIAQEGDDDQSPTFQQVLERGAFAECKTEQKSLLAAAKTHHFLLKQNSAFLKARRRFSSSNNNIDDGEESKLSKESKLKFASLPQLASTAAIKQQLQLQTELQQQPQTLAHTQAYLAESIQLYHGLTGSGNDVNDDSEGCPEEIESVLAVGIASRIAAFNVMTTSTLPTSKSNGSIAAIENDKSPCIAVDSSTFQEEIALSSMKTNQFGETLDLDVVPVVSPRESEKSGESLPETTVQDCIDLNLDVERPSQCATPKPHVGSERLSIAVSSSFSDTRESVSSAYASISNTATTTRYISPHVDSHQWPESASSIRSSNASVGTTKTTNSAALYDASSSSKNPMKPRKSFMSTVSTSSSIASSQTTRSIPFSEKGSVHSGFFTLSHRD
ncbi:hypothetical protein BDR26DRAFT_41730 [Obelidium mucronatum]|nr:hypothetical protein BDR26DRAFT_41730 [Obelidium mucronatum]